MMFYSVERRISRNNRREFLHLWVNYTPILAGWHFPEADFWPGMASGLVGIEFSMSVVA